MSQNKGLFETDNSKELTAIAMNDPQIGDRFSEMFAFWMYVIDRNGDMITFMEANPPCTLPEDGKIGTLPLSKFKRKYAYNTIPGYSIRLIDRGNKVDGWKQACKNVIEIEEHCPYCGRKYR